MRSLCTLFVMIAAAAALSAQTRSAQTRSAQPASTQAASMQTASTQTTSDATQPEPSLVRTTEVQPGDSPLVQAAKRALAKRRSTTNRLTVVLPGKGHISQGSIPLKPAVVPPEPKPAASGIDPEVVRKRNEDIQRRIDALVAEQKRYGAEADEVVGNDIDEEEVAKRLSNLQQRIDALRLQLKQAPPSQR